MEIFHWTSRKVIAIVIIFMFLGILIGYIWGSYVTIKVIAKIASGFIDIDEELIQQARFQYENDIRTCYPPKQDALICNTTRN